jgi:multidrug efflux system membrane fusion protein
MLWPGQFVNVKVRVATLPQALTVPVTAIQRGPDGALAYIVKNDGTVEARKLALGEISEGMAVVDEGINEGESVVTAGQYRLQPGTRVETTMAADTGAAPAKRE